MNGPLRRVSTVVALLFAALFISTTLIQVIFAPSINARPDNRRTLLDNYSRQRGAILVGDQPVAVSQPTPNEEIKYLRSYPQPLPYSHVTGYFSYTYGAGGGLEGAADDLLSGSSSQFFYTRVTDLLTGKQPVGATVQTTINPKAQDAADKALGNQRGAVVALDPKTGAILAMISHPQYDPNRLSAHDQASVVKAWNELNADPTQPLVNRAIAGNLYPPGSVFKIVTAAAALENGKVDTTTQIPAPGVMELPQTTAGLPNYDRQPCGPNNQTTLQHALEISCNTAMGYLGMQVGAQALADQAAKFGFGTTMRIPTRVEPSRFPTGINQAQTAQSAIGQYDVRVTPTAGRHGQRGHRQRGCGHAPVPHQPGAQRRPADHRPHLPGAARDRGVVADGGHAHPDARRGRRPGHRHAGQDQRRPGGRQDGDRRAGQRQAATRLVHGVRPRERPEGCGRRRRRGRWQRRKRGRRGASRRTHRQSSHGSGAQPVISA